ncbi:hypothetical protein CBR_g64831 [Chara braunii]|uniref:Uncharacterized protein n=1 Tax=Chara braunii TaxID=69332 RepID=A0A388K939_CHABU|nr:hypothetical protein CBR_g64831 [Chara braunii]|eukprot:GBG66560.1 hypothetical protein CBR_g64831 [Chara braunii]
MLGQITIGLAIHYSSSSSSSSSFFVFFFVFIFRMDCLSKQQSNDAVRHKAALMEQPNYEANRYTEREDKARYAYRQLGNSAAKHKAMQTKRANYTTDKHIARKDRTAHKLSTRKGKACKCAERQLLSGAQGNTNTAAKLAASTPAARNGMRSMMGSVHCDL